MKNQSRWKLLQRARDEAEVRAHAEHKRFAIIEYPEENFFEVVPADQLNFDIRPLPMQQVAGADSRFYRKAGMK